jgi:hypothetical protein
MICGTIGWNDTLGRLTMVQQMEPSLNAIGIRLPVNRLIAVTVHPVACPAAPRPIGRHRHRRRAICALEDLSEHRQRPPGPHRTVLLLEQIAIDQDAADGLTSRH